MLRQELNEMMAEDVRIRFVGNLDALPASLQGEIDHAMNQTKENRGINFTVATNYGGRHEIVQACQTIAQRVQAGEPYLQPEKRLLRPVSVPFHFVVTPRN